MSKNAAAEYGESGIRINTVSPGWVNTGMMSKTLENYRKIGIKDPEEYLGLGPAQRAAEPEEIADVICFLCSDKAKFINGSNIVVDGGKLTE